MLRKLRILALCSTALVSTAALAQTTTPAQPAAGSAPAAVFDLNQLPAFKGKVQLFTLTPRGDIDGLLLADGTEVKLPPHLTSEIAAAVKIGDAVTVHGLHAAAIPLVVANSLTNDATGVVAVDNGPGDPGGPGGPGGPGKKGHEGGSGHRSWFGWLRGATDGATTDVQGRVKADLHGPRGEVNGALLEDGTVLRLPPPEAERQASLLAPGQAITAHGVLKTNAYGKVLDVRTIGASTATPSDGQTAPKG
jgi:hypothetical protein